MGANVSKSIENVSTKIMNTLEQQAGASAVANCSVRTGDIILKNANQCSVVNQNRCTANSAAAISAISDAASKAFLEASSQQQTSLLPGLNSNDTEQTIKNAIQQKINQ